jgi:hypothetical protein
MKLLLNQEVATFVGTELNMTALFDPALGLHLITEDIEQTIVSMNDPQDRMIFSTEEIEGSEDLRLVMTANDQVLHDVVSVTLRTTSGTEEVVLTKEQFENVGATYYNEDGSRVVNFTDITPGSVIISATKATGNKA